MKRLLVRLGWCSAIAVLGAVIISSCAAGGGTSAPRPNAIMSRNANVKLDVLDGGYQTFLTHCASCHTDKVPVPKFGRFWHPPEMGLTLYQTLNDYERYAVVEYMFAVDRFRLKADWGALQDRR